MPVARPQSNEKSDILQGKCHHCKQWVPLEGCKVGDLKVGVVVLLSHPLFVLCYVVCVVVFAVFPFCACVRCRVLFYVMLT